MFRLRGLLRQQPPSSSSTATQHGNNASNDDDDATAKRHALDRRKIGMKVMPVKSQQELSAETQDAQRAHTSQEDAKVAGVDNNGTPPVVRSILEMAHLMMLGYSCKLKACPGYQGGVFYNGKPFCIACGYRDGSKPLEMDDKANHMRLKDPMVYGSLSLPVTSMLLCQLHEEGVFDLEKPLVEYFPDLERVGFTSRFTGRSVLKFETVVDSNAVLRGAGASSWKPYFAWNACASMQQHVYAPLTKYLQASSSKPLSGAEQRFNFLRSVCAAKSYAKPRYVPLGRAKVCHFSVALLLAVVEQQLGGKSFEDVMRAKIFTPTQSNAAGYGAPMVYRDPGEMFYKPIGQAAQHQLFKKPLPVGAPGNAAPALFNGSMNLYAPAEEYAKLLFLSLETVHNARKVLGAESVSYPHYDFGMLYRPDRNEYSLSRNAFTGLDFIPTSTTFRYNAEHDVGVFALSSCGTRNGRIFSNAFSRVLQHLFLEHVTKKGINPDASSNDPEAEKSETETKFEKIKEDVKYTTAFKGHNAHKRF